MNAVSLCAMNHTLQIAPPLASPGSGSMPPLSARSLCPGSCGLMDKAPDFGSGDCRFESCHVRVNFCANMNLLWRSPNYASTAQVLLGPPPTTTSLEKQTVIRLFWKYLVINSMSVVISRARAVLVKIYPLEVLPYFILISSYKQQCHKLFK